MPELLGAWPLDDYFERPDEPYSLDRAFKDIVAYDGVHRDLSYYETTAMNGPNIGSVDWQIYKDQIRATLQAPGVRFNWDQMSGYLYPFKYPGTTIGSNHGASSLLSFASGSDSTFPLTSSRAITLRFTPRKTAAEPGGSYGTWTGPIIGELGMTAGGSRQSGWALMVDQQSCAAVWYISRSVENDHPDDNNRATVIWTPPLEPDIEYHVVMQFELATTRWSFYLNGSLVGEDFHHIGATGGNFAIGEGTEDWGATDVEWRYFGGIRDIKAYNTALTDPEIKTDMNPVPVGDPVLDGVSFRIGRGLTASKTIEQAVRSPGSLALYYRMGETFSFPTASPWQVPNAFLDTSNFDAFPKNLRYQEDHVSGWNDSLRPSLNVASPLVSGDDGAAIANNTPGFEVPGAYAYANTAGRSAFHQNVRSLSFLFKAGNGSGVLISNITGTLFVGFGGFAFYNDGYFSLGLTGASDNFHFDSPGVTVGDWYHAVITRDVSFSPDKWTYYLNGVVVDTASSNRTDQGYFANSDELWLWYEQGWPRIGAGGLDEIAFYNKVLSPEEVNEIFVAGISENPVGAPTPGAIALDGISFRS